MNILSLFSNIGVSEGFLNDMGFPVVLANESDKRRAQLYSTIYPETEMIEGDFNNKNIFNTIIKKSEELNVEIIISTPPCQGMSTVGPKKSDDVRNNLILPTVDCIKRVLPKFVIIENVPLFLKTLIYYKGERVAIADLITREMESLYHIQSNIIDTKDFGIPQMRKRAIILLSKRKHNSLKWRIPLKNNNNPNMHDSIGSIPIIDPFIRDVSESELLKIFPKYYQREKRALRISKWNKPPVHIKRQVITMMHTPTGCSAFENEKFKPQKENGDPIKGFRNTYKRQNWDTPAYTITMDNRKISSQNNVHPGRLLYKNDDGIGIYSDPRALTLYEIMKIMTIPDNWPIPSNTSEAFIRRIIGEGIPSLFLKKLFHELLK